MGRRWFACVRVFPELLRDPVALDTFLDDADFYAPPGAVAPRVTGLRVSASDQDPSDICTVVRVLGDESGARLERS